MAELTELVERFAHNGDDRCILDAVQGRRVSGSRARGCDAGGIPSGSGGGSGGSVSGSGSGSGSGSDNIPVIDVAPFLRSSAHAAGALPRGTARAWDRAFRTHGFASIVGHGLDNAALEAVRRAAQQFFALPAADKERSNLGRGYGAGGYVPSGVESVARSTGDAAGAAAPPDAVESLVFLAGASAADGDGNGNGGSGTVGTGGDVVPAQPAALGPAVRAYWRQASQLLRGLMRLSAAALGLPEDFFEPTYARGAARRCGWRNSPCASGGRHVRAPRCPHGLRRADHPGAGPRGWVGGAGRGGRWERVRPVRGALVVNAGDLISRWTNGCGRAIRIAS